MRTFRLHKLIRDKVFDNMLVLGEKVERNELDNAGFLQALKDKLVEEFKELNVDDDKALYELADLLEIIETLVNELGGDFEKLREQQLATRSKRGGFNKRIFVETVTLTDDDEWVQYYEGQPERFIEIKEITHE